MNRGYRYQLTRNTHKYHEQVGPQDTYSALEWEILGQYGKFEDASKRASESSWVNFGWDVRWNPQQLHPAPDWERMPTENGIEKLPPEYDYYSMDGNFHIYQYRVILP